MGRKGHCTVCLNRARKLPLRNVCWSQNLIFVLRSSSFFTCVSSFSSATSQMKPWLLLPLLSVCVFPLILGYWPRRRWNASPFLSLRYRGNEGLEESSVGVPCTANDLLPGFGRDYVNGWVHAKSSGDIPTAGLPTYNCTCPYMKAG